MGEQQMIRALVFDFDGLILDTETPEFQAWQKVFDDYGGSLRLEEWMQCVGSSYPCFDVYAELERQVGCQFDREEIRVRKREYFNNFFRDRQVRPGVMDYLEGARRLGLGIGLASSATRDWVVPHLTDLGIRSFFEVIKTAEDVERTKPNPELFQAAVAGLGVAPERAVSMRGFFSIAAAQVS